MQYIARVRRAAALGAVALVFGAGIWTSSVEAQGIGCRSELGRETGARVTAQLVRPATDGQPTSADPPTTELEARSGHVLRLLVRPNEGPSQPPGPECPVRVRFGGLSSVARQVTRSGFVFDRGAAYAQQRPDEERVIEFEIRPFAEWNSLPDKVEVENVTIRLPEGDEFIGRLAPSSPPPAGTVCADVVHPDATPAVGVAIGLAAPVEGPRDVRQVGPDGRVCWEDFDPLRYGELSVEAPAEPALGQPRTRYVSYEARHRLFVVKRPS